jgi:hypothetical protein
MTLSIAQLVIFTVAAGIGGYLAGKLFGCNMSLPVSFAVAAIGAITYLIPTVGAFVSLVSMVIATWRFSDGEIMASLLTAGVARLLVIPAFLGLDTILTW